MTNNLLTTLMVLLCTTQVIWAQGFSTHEKITPQELMTWHTVDKGQREIEGNTIVMEETAGANGYFLISPKQYAGDMILRYKVKAISESSVLITLFSVTDGESTTGISLPPNNSSGSEIWQWRSNLKHYNLTFNNISHNYKPFFFKNLSPRAKGFHHSLAENISEVGAWNDVEIGKEGSRLWFKLNGKIYFDVEDCNPLEAGQLMFRISGTTGDKTIFAKAAIKDLVISTK